MHVELYIHVSMCVCTHLHIYIHVYNNYINVHYFFSPNRECIDCYDTSIQGVIYCRLLYRFNLHASLIYF